MDRSRELSRSQNKPSKSVQVLVLRTPVNVILPSQLATSLFTLQQQIPSSLPFWSLLQLPTQPRLLQVTSQWQAVFPSTTRLCTPSSPNTPSSPPPSRPTSNLPPPLSTLSSTSTHAPATQPSRTYSVQSSVTLANLFSQVMRLVRSWWGCKI